MYACSHKHRYWVGFKSVLRILRPIFDSNSCPFCVTYVIYVHFVSYFQVRPFYATYAHSVCLVLRSPRWRGGRSFASHAGDRGSIPAVATDLNCKDR